MNAIKNITIGHTERLYKPVGYTMLVNLVNIIPFCLSIEAVRIIFAAFDGSGRPLDTARLWCIFGILAVYMLVMALAERASYRANFRGAYEMSASGRIALAEHLRKLSLGFLSRRDPGDLSSMLVTDFTMAETGISHHLPQLMGAVVMPVLAFLSLVWIDWRMAVAMFAALPVALLVLWMSTSVQKKLSGKQIQAKINAGNRLEEYLQGIRVMKAYNLLGDRFVRLRNAFAELRRACIRQEALLGPFVLLCITLVRAGLTLMVLCGTYLLLGGELSLLVFVLFLVVGSRVFDPLTSALTNFAEFRYFSIAGGRILTLMNEPEMEGERQVERQIEYYNLDVIISVGYRVKSQRGVQFRMWATAILKEFMKKGFVLDDDRLKNLGGGNYFDELLTRIRDIRSSEKVFWRKVLEIYATSIDYDPKAESTVLFFKQVQNKMHWAAHQHTAAEVIYQRADAEKEHMGLTSWRGEQIHRADVEVAKNYLSQPELDALNKIVTAYLDIAEVRALNHEPMYMKDWLETIDDYLKMTRREILTTSGHVSNQQALQKAHAEYDKYKKQQDLRLSPVEQSFLDSVEQLERLEDQAH